MWSDEPPHSKLLSLCLRKILVVCVPLLAIGEAGLRWLSPDETPRQSFGIFFLEGLGILVMIPVIAMTGDWLVARRTTWQQREDGIEIVSVSGRVRTIALKDIRRASLLPGGVFLITNAGQRFIFNYLPDAQKEEWRKFFVRSGKMQ
ncbi:MAG: hypothetical protein JWO94_3116, partial [Verrucomicrobiaceae bacterium]|nr:hypothetical protein [Verrucomicrobiaceae bacterium]